MIHEEPTTEIELPWVKKKEEVQEAKLLNFPEKELVAVEKLSRRTQWILRIMAFVAILALSFLIV